MTGEPMVGPSGPPTVLDLARQLLGGELEPHRAADRFSLEAGRVYWYCLGKAPMADGHAPDCPWLRRHEVIAALERAQPEEATDDLPEGSA